jgi:large subunit ribosomal protein L23
MGVNHKYVIRDRKSPLGEEQIYSVLRGAIVTEKTTQRQPCHFFWVAMWANKFHIKQAVESIFNVQVASVNTLCLKGKSKRFRGQLGVRSDTKKAMVLLKDGHTLDVSNGVVS